MGLFSDLIWHPFGLGREDEESSCRSRESSDDGGPKDVTDKSWSDRTDAEKYGYCRSSEDEAAESDTSDADDDDD